jgi:glycosyltransferase involved in cell wall biosynthesis
MAAGPPNLVFANPIYGKAKVDALASCDLYVQLSRWEGMSFALLEAMSVGTPCVVSEEVATTVDEPGCMITLSTQVDVAARIVRELLAESSRRSRVGRSAREWVTRHCSPEAVTSALLVVYEEAATSHVVRDGALKLALAGRVQKAHRG